ncbi:MAG TPA: MFS transporter [Chthoniobacter sp.]|nr:MFS transporter [Chthoniobacter sp.]
MSSSSSRRNVLTLLAAFLGWLFDGFEMGMFPLIGQPALKDLLHNDNIPPEVMNTLASQWFGVIIAVFLVGAASGGVLFGWLGDKIGRVRAMALSIFTYAIFTGLCGFATEAWQITLLRFIASLGMGGEWSLGVALVNEVWSGKSRAVTAGLIGAAANIGYLLVALLSMVLLSFISSAQHGLAAIGLSPATVTYLTANSAWRLLMISGALPAFLNFGVLLFVPESEKWKAEQARGATAHWARLDLFGVLIGSVAALGIIWAWSPAGVSALPAIGITIVGLGIALVGYLHPVRRYMHRAEAAGSLAQGRGKALIRLMLFGAALSAVALLGTWGSTQWAPKWVTEQLAPTVPHAKEWTLIWLSIGAIVGTMVAALAAGRFGRRITYCMLCITSIGGTLLLYQCNDSYSNFFLFSTFVAGTVTASFYGFFPLYLPELLPTAIRATGQGFAYNFGRIIAAVGGLQTANLMKFFGGSFPKAASCMAAIYVVGIFLVWFGPETKGQPLPE